VGKARSKVVAAGRSAPTQAGQNFFEHKGKTDLIDLIRNGAAGKAAIPLQ
jgi:hypothetical protein